MSRARDCILSRTNRKRLLKEIREKRLAPLNVIERLRDEVEDPEISCQMCGRKIRGGSRIHVIRSSISVRIYHRSCFEGSFFG